MARTMKVSTVRIALVGLALLAPACAKSASTPEPAATAQPAAPAPLSSPGAASAAPPPGGVALPDRVALQGDLAGGDLVGKPAPDFTATSQDGAPVHLASLRGKAVVLYFYPKDETPGCTKEACSFRDSWQAIAKTGAVLVGVSGDNRESHKAFAEHYGLPFILVSDPDGHIGKSYGVPFEGHHQRQTIVIARDGNVQKVYRKVDVSVHAAQVLADLSHAG